MKGRVGFPLLALTGALLIVCACTKPPGERRHFRSDQFYLEATLPPGWAAAEGPTSLARPFTGWVAFNSWGDADFWAPEVVTETEQGIHASYGPEDVLGQLPPDGGYVVLSHLSGGPVRAAEEYGPEHERQDLGTLWEQSDCREGDTHPGASVAVTGFAGRAFACTCAPPGSPADELERSTAVFAGKVTGVELPGGDVISSADPVEVTFRVFTVWKGPTRDPLVVTTARSSISCGYEFETAKEYLVYAYGEEDDLQVSLCSRTRPLALAGADLAALGRGDGGDIGAELQVYKYLGVVAVVMAVAIGVGVGALLSRRARR
ncbi:MAG: hypothetical protein U9R72_12795 [Chloroflexota bacterium]|nr:hypothetical protein [Chloroflexota bacterium]